MIQFIDQLPSGAATSQEVNVFKSDLKFSWVKQLRAKRVACAEEVKQSQDLYDRLSRPGVGLLYREPYPLGAYYYHPPHFSRRAP